MHPLIPSFCLLCALTAVAIAEQVHWNQFRGPNGSGVAETFLSPLHFDGARPAWKTPLPPGKSSPVLWADRIFITAIEDHQLVTFGIDATSGNVLWKRTAPQTSLETVHAANSPAASTPCADEERVYVYFGSYGLLCYDHDGNEVWRMAIPTPKTLYGMSSSPILHENRLLLVLDDDSNLSDSSLSRSKVIALDRETGTLIWETPRPFNRSGWSTPMIWNHEHGSDLAVMGSGRAYAYDPATGAEKWYVNGFSRETIAVPVAGKDRLYFSTSRLGGWGDSKLDPEPFWKATLAFDTNGDQRIGRDEITEDFTIPFRPELPPGHPGFGLPLPNNPEARKERQQGLFNLRDTNKDGFWSKVEFVSAMSADSGKPNLTAVKPGGSGDVTETYVAWTLHNGIPEIPSPIFYHDRIYLIRSGGILSCINADNADVVYRERIESPGLFSASPVIGNTHLYFVSDRGVITVVKPGDAFEVVHQADLGEPVPATPALDQNSLYVRTEKSLIAFR